LSLREQKTVERIFMVNIHGAGDARMAKRDRQQTRVIALSSVGLNLQVGALALSAHFGQRHVLSVRLKGA
jgi:hypothetical protein